MSAIRILGADEVPMLLPGARAFFGEGRLHGSLNEAHFVDTLARYIEQGIGFVLASLDEDDGTVLGAIAGLVYPDLATADPVAMEYFWWVDKRHRGLTGPRLLVRFEEECAARGVKRIMMMHLVYEGADKFARFYEARGYELREQIFTKSLGTATAA